jgi:GTP cyclohydrolase II
MPVPPVPKADFDESSQEMAAWVEAPLPTRHGAVRCVVFTMEEEPSREHVALVTGDVRGGDVLTRVHSECLTSEVFGSLKCDCRDQLDLACARIAKEQRGVVVYLRQEGRGIGLADKIRAYALQENGLDTLEANRALGLPDDARRYQAAAAVLRALGVTSVRLMTNAPEKLRALEALGVRVLSRVPLVTGSRPESAAYLSAKRNRLHHLLPRSTTTHDLGSLPCVSSFRRP